MGQAVAQGERVEDRYHLQKVSLGRGSFGSVCRGVDRSSGAVVAIKQLDRQALAHKYGGGASDFEREVAMMRACVHENVLRLIDVFEDAGRVSLVVEYCDGGDFGDKVKERGSAIQEVEVADFMRQMCSAIAALHAKRICHRDVKPDNFLVSGTSLLKLADFGLSVYVPPGQLLKHKCGTPAFMAPELHALPQHSPGYSLPVDMWAAGVSLQMLMSGGQLPFSGADGKLDMSRLMRGALELPLRSPAQSMFTAAAAPAPGAAQRFSAAARGLCGRLVLPDAQSRLSAAAALREPWLARQPRAAAAPAGLPGRASPAFAASGAATADARARVCAAAAGGLVPGSAARDSGVATPAQARPHRAAAAAPVAARVAPQMSPAVAGVLHAAAGPAVVGGVYPPPTEAGAVPERAEQAGVLDAAVDTLAAVGGVRPSAVEAGAVPERAVQAAAARGEGKPRRRSPSAPTPTQAHEAPTSAPEAASLNAADIDVDVGGGSGVGMCVGARDPSTDGGASGDAVATGAAPPQEARAGGPGEEAPAAPRKDAGVQVDRTPRGISPPLLQRQADFEALEAAIGQREAEKEALSAQIRDLKSRLAELQAAVDASTTDTLGSCAASDSEVAAATVPRAGDGAVAAMRPAAAARGDTAVVEGADASITDADAEVYDDFVVFDVGQDACSEKCPKELPQCADESDQLHRELAHQASTIAQQEAEIAKRDSELSSLRALIAAPPAAPPGATRPACCAVM